MNITVIIIEALLFAAFFTVMVFWMTKNKHTPAGIHNYPEDIQEEYFKTHPRVDVSYRSRNVVLTKSLGLILFAGIFVLCAHFAGARTFAQGFWVGLGLMVFIGCYDTFFLDWVLFANLKIFRLEGTEHMDEAYHQKWFHLKGILFPGSLFGLIVGVVTGLITMWIH